MDQLIRRDSLSGYSTWYASYVLSSFLPKWNLPVKRSPKNFPTDMARELLLCGREIFHSGSRVDGLSIPRYYKRTEGESREPTGIESDDDKMLVLHMCPIGQYGDITTHLVVDSTQTMPGYVRLLHVTSPRATICRRSYAYGIHEVDKETGQLRTYFSFNQMHQMKKYDGDTGAGRDMRELAAKHGWNITETINGPAYTTHVENISTYVETIFSGDLALALHSSQWPDAAESWIHRLRPYGWPPHELISDIVEGGCHFVNTAHRLSLRPAIEWRLSFSFAEKTLARSFTDSERQCYTILKIMVSYSTRPNSTISSFCLKNVFFWKMEQIPKHLWDRISDCCFIVLDDLIHRAVEGHLPHYFIPQNNLLLAKSRKCLLSSLRTLCNLRRKFLHKILDFDLKHAVNIRNSPISTYLRHFLHTDRDKSMMDFLSDVERAYVDRLCGYAKNMSSEIFSYTLKEAVDDYHAYTSDEQVIQACIAHASAHVGQENLVLGIAWCAFTHYHWLDNNMLKLVWTQQRIYLEECFRKAIGDADRQEQKSYAMLYYGIYLLHENRKQESWDLFRNIESSHQNDPDLYGKSRVTFTEFDAIVLDYSLEEELLGKNSESLNYPLMSIVYHFLVKSKFDLCSDMSIEAVLSKYERFCKLLTTLDALHSYGLLGQDLLGMKCYVRALNVFRLQHILCQSLPAGQNNKWFDKIQQYIQRCESELE